MNSILRHFLLRRCDRKRFLTAGRLFNVSLVSSSPMLNSGYLFKRFLSSETQSNVERSASVSSEPQPVELVISDSRNLAKMICSRLDSKSCLGFIDLIKFMEVSEAKTGNDLKTDLQSKYKLISKMAKKDRWVMSWLLYVLNNSTAKRTPFPIYTYVPTSDIAFLHISCLTETLLRAKAFLVKGKFSFNERDPSNDVDEAARLAENIVNSSPIASSEELVRIVEEYSREEISDKLLRSKLLTVLTIHVEYVHDILSFLEVDAPKSFDIKIRAAIIRRTNLERSIADEVETLIDKIRKKHAESDVRNADGTESEKMCIEDVSEQMRKRFRHSESYCLRVTLKCASVLSSIKSKASKLGSKFSRMENNISWKDYCDHPRKVIVTNLPPGITNTAELKEALSNIGDISDTAIWLFKEEDSESMQKKAIVSKMRLNSASPPSPAKEIVDIVDESRKELNSYASESSSMTFAPSDQPVAARKNPLATLASIDMSARRFLRKSVLKDEKYDNLAFVAFDTDEGMARATREDVRVFGVCVQGTICSLSRASVLKSLEVELLTVIGLEDIINMLSAYLGPEIEYSGAQRPDTSNLQPVFVHIDFENHQQAWKAFECLDEGARDGLPIKVTWLKTQYYYALAEKDRVWRMTKPSVEKLAESDLEGEDFK